jgi:hypothetical protein
MKRDFLMALYKPQSLLKQLRKLTIGTAIAAVGFISGSSASASTAGQITQGTVTPTIVEKSKKTPKLVLKLASSGKMVSASHASHRSHSSHSSHRSHSSHYSGSTR